MHIRIDRIEAIHVHGRFISIMGSGEENDTCFRWNVDTVNVRVVERTTGELFYFTPENYQQTAARIDACVVEA